MLPLPDPRPLAALTPPALLALVACAAALTGWYAVRSGSAPLSALCGVVFLTATLLGWAASVARREAIRNFPTSTAGGAALGYVELVGGAESGAHPALRSQLGKRPCVWHRFRIAHRVGVSWIPDAAGSSEDCFVLRDTTGTCVIDPEGAEIVPQRQRRWREFGTRYHEQWIAPGDTVYVLGELTSVAAALDAPSDLKRDLSELLAQWKRDPQELMRRFDANRNGSLEDGEWAQARHAAHEEVEREWTARHSLGPLNLMRKPRDGRRYLISAYAPEELAARFARWAWLHLALFAGALVLIGLATSTL